MLSWHFHKYIHINKFTLLYGSEGLLKVWNPALSPISVADHWLCDLGQVAWLFSTLCLSPIAQGGLAAKWDDVCKAHSSTPAWNGPADYHWFPPFYLHAACFKRNGLCVSHTIRLCPWTFNGIVFAMGETLPDSRVYEPGWLMRVIYHNSMDP